jgi:signal transduction histidine kinase/CheY-like chemotaxis protein
LNKPIFEEVVPRPESPPGDISDHLLDFRIDITRRASLAILLVAGTATWMVMSLNPFPAWAFLTLLILMAIAAVARQYAEAYPRLARVGLFAGLLLGALGLMFGNIETWIPFITLPVIFLGSILVERGEFISGAGVMAAAIILDALNVRTYPLLALAISLILTISVAWVVTFMVNTTLTWYQGTLQQAGQLLAETRRHRGELSKALKNLTLANDLQRRTEKELIIARKSAEEARVLKEKFAAKVSHELRTPLALIAGFSDVMYNTPEIYGDVSWSPILRRDVAQVYQNSNHLLAMVDDILNLSRFEMTGFTISLENVNLTEMMRETAEIAADLFLSPDVHFSTSIPPDLPVLRIDRTRIRQVVLNLVNNARRFTTKGEVTVMARVVDQEVVISVSDTGPGISKDQLELIFQEFYQVEDSFLKNKGGTGLGLAICKHFVETHGGRIWAESELGQGSTFSFSLPAGGVFLGSDSEMPAGLIAAAALPRILVVGGDDHVLAMLRSVVSGYEFFPVDTPDRLAPLIALYHPRAVIMNILPGDDPEAQIFNETLPIPVILCSLPSTLWLVKNFGIHACLSKPVTRDMLLHELERLPEIRKIIVVDDDFEFVQLVQRIFQTINSEFDIQVAHEGRTGLAAIRAYQPDLVILDLTMPELDGFGVIAEMKKEPDLADLPVILLTATLTPERLLSFPANRILVERNGEMRTIETLNLIKASLGALETRYDDTTDEVISKIGQGER